MLRILLVLAGGFVMVLGLGLSSQLSTRPAGIAFLCLGAIAIARGIIRPRELDADEPLTPAQLRKEIRKASRSRSGNAFGCGCLLVVIGTISTLTVVLSPIGVPLFLIGVGVMIVSLFL